VTAQVFYWPLAVLGFPLGMFVTMSTMNTLYQFWIHTRTITTMGPLEWVMNTPSHHRVHHGANPKYLDKNYAGSSSSGTACSARSKRKKKSPSTGP